MVARGRFELPSMGLFLVRGSKAHHWPGHCFRPLLVHYTTGLRETRVLGQVPISLLSNPITRGWNPLPDTSRDTSNHGRLLLRVRAYALARICRRPGPSWNSADVEGRRTTNTTSEERISNPGIMLRQLLGQEKRRAVHGNSEQLTNHKIVKSRQPIFK